MRVLNPMELDFVAGGEGECTPEDSGNTYGGVSDTSSLGEDLIEIYEGLVEAASYIIERVANAI